MAVSIAALLIFYTTAALLILYTTLFSLQALYNVL
jgi:hypothetical protein